MSTEEGGGQKLSRIQVINKELVQAEMHRQKHMKKAPLVPMLEGIAVKERWHQSRELCSFDSFLKHLRPTLMNSDSV